jgi:hypothetical protein
MGLDSGTALTCEMSRCRIAAVRALCVACSSSANMGQNSRKVSVVPLEEASWNLS